jgi:hypothetical protein
VNLREREGPNHALAGTRLGDFHVRRRRAAPTTQVDSITGLEGEALKTALQELAAKHTPTLKAKDA